MKHRLGKFVLIAILLFLTNAVVMAGTSEPTGRISEASCDDTSVTLTYTVNDLGESDLTIFAIYISDDEFDGYTIADLPDKSGTSTVDIAKDKSHVIMALAYDVGGGLFGFIDILNVFCDGHYPAFRDGRINNYDAAAPVAVYPTVDANGAIGLEIYDVDGILILSISAEQLAAAVVNPDSPVLIAESPGAALYLLPDGSWQINALQYNGKTYAMIFTELYPNAGYTSYEIEP